MSKKILVTVTILLGLLVLWQSGVMAPKPLATVKGKEISVTLNKVETDLRIIHIAGRVRGTGKIVAVEVKQELPGSAGGDQDYRSGTDLKWGMRGLWIGGAWWRPFGSAFNFSISHKLDITEPHLYVVFYTSKGEALASRIPIDPKLKDVVREVSVNRTIDLDGAQITVTRISFGLTQTILEFKANYSGNQTEFILTDLTSGSAYKNAGYSTWGSGKSFEGGANFAQIIPPPAGQMKLTLRKTDSGSEKSINILP